MQMKSGAEMECPGDGRRTLRTGWNGSQGRWVSVVDTRVPWLNGDVDDTEVQFPLTRGQAATSCVIQPTTDSHRPLVLPNNITHSQLNRQLCFLSLKYIVLLPPPKEVMFLVLSVCLFVCPSVHRITEKVANGF